MHKSLFVESLDRARELLVPLGLEYRSSSPHDYGDREYWGFSNGEDAFLDHSATLTPMGNGRVGVAVFGPAAAELEG